jgi:DNA-binding GntR family transcriptional regulator
MEFVLRRSDVADVASGGVGADADQEVMDAVLLARIAPGTEISLAALAARCRVRPAEADVAVERLRSMGLVSIEGDLIRIAPCDVRDVLAKLDLRRELEIRIVRAAALHATDLQLDGMRASESLLRRCALVGDLDGFMNAERCLEATLVAASGLSSEGEELKRIKVEFRRAWCAVNRLRTFTHVANIRTALVAAVAARDPDAAEASIRVFLEHLVKTY